MTKIRHSLIGAAIAALLTSAGPAIAQESLPLPGPENVPISDDSDLGMLTPPPLVFEEFLALGPEGGPPGGPGGPGGQGGPAWGGMHRRGGGPLGALQGSLALSDDQYERLYAIKSQFDDSIGPKRLQMRTIGRRLCENLSSANIDTSKVKDLQSQMTSLMTDTSKMHGDKLLAYAQVLTAEQRKAVHDAMIKRSLGRDLGMGMGMGMHKHGHHGH